MIKHFKAHNVILFLNNLIAELIDEECLKERNEKLVLMSKKIRRKRIRREILIRTRMRIRCAFTVRKQFTLRIITENYTQKRCLKS